jgi:hypothetical protein
LHHGIDQYFGIDCHRQADCALASVIPDDKTTTARALARGNHAGPANPETITIAIDEGETERV